MNGNATVPPPRTMLISVAAILAVAHGVSAMSSQPRPTEKEKTTFVSKTIEVDGVTYPYAVYIPTDYTAQRSWPLILALHGSGERGQDGIRQTKVGIGPAIRQHPERFPCIVVMPQCPPERVWDGSMLPVVLGTLNSAIQEYNIDQDRIVLTGLSLGGFGTWYYGAVYSERFAALVPICAGGDPKAAERLARLPIWSWHGDADDAVPVQRSRDIVEAVRKAGGNVKYTELPGVGHNSWDTAYGDPDLVKWMLAQTRKPPTNQPNP